MFIECKGKKKKEFVSENVGYLTSLKKFQACYISNLSNENVIDTWLASIILA